MEVQSSWAADSIEPQPDKAKVAITAKKARGRNVVEFIPQVYLIPPSGSREAPHQTKGQEGT